MTSPDHPADVHGRILEEFPHDNPPRFTKAEKANAYFFHDFVLQSKPCPFLEKDNKCQIYDVRPSDCQRFPYTDEDVFIKQPALTLMNASFCPAVNVVLERLMEIK